jgi:hypothetical protein
MAERYQLPRSCVPPTTRRKDGGSPPSGGLEGRKTRCIREHEDMVALQRGHPPFKDGSPYSRPQPSRAKSSPTHSKVLPYGAGARSHTSCKPTQGRRSQTAVRGAHNRQRLQATLHFCPDQRAKGWAAMQAACNHAKWARSSDSQHARHRGPGPRVVQPVRRLLRVSNCIATRATTAPPRLRNQYRDSRRPGAWPSSASLARWSTRPEVGRQ